jgi:circadian clock protein KaiC
MTDGSRVSTGIDGLDRVMKGGFPKARIMLVEGAPGTGKTTLALHLLKAAADRGERALFYSVAQSGPELDMIASSHGFSLDGIDVRTPEIGKSDRSRIFSVESEEAELVELMEDVARQIEAVKPDVFVFDSLLELRLLASTEVVYRRELLSLRYRLRNLEITALLIDHMEPEGGERSSEGIVHGVIKLDAVTPSIGTTQRRLTVLKLRGAPFVEGWHDFRINTGGVQVFPRVIPEDAQAVALEDMLEPTNEPFRRLLGGGLEFGTTLLIAGQSGTGKSTLATMLANDAAARGLKTAMFLFEERPEVLTARSSGVGLDIAQHKAGGMLRLCHFDPAEVSPGEFSNATISAVDEGARVIVIDSLTGYINALPEQSSVLIHMNALLQYLARREVLTIVIISQHGLLGEVPTTNIETSFLADSVILLRQYETGAEIRRSIAVLKKRQSEHQRNIEELVIRSGSVEVRALSEEAEERAKRASQLGAE